MKKVKAIYVHIIIALGLALLTICVPKLDFDSTIAEEEVAKKNHFDFSEYTSDINDNNLLQKFPFEVYLAAVGFNNIVSLQKEILQLDSIKSINDKTLNLQVLTIALTDSLRSKYSFSTYNPDSLIRLIQWAEKFKSYAVLDKKNALMHQSIYDYWMSFTANKLSTYYEANNKLKYDFKFRYLQNRCAEQRYGTTIGNDKLYKTVNYFIDSRWAHMFDRFNTGTGFLFKFFIFLFVLFTIYGYYAIFKLHYKNKP